MREIKFRIWNVKGWVGADAVYLNGKDAPIIEMENKFSGLKVMQFTGLKDKNGKGKEVYQGDLIKFCANGYEPREIYEIVWDEERLEWGLKNRLGLITSLWTADKEFEVIGDIYSNPELLTK